jgi:hypothetical protein
MTPLFQKLNLKQHPAVVVLDAPATFDAALAELAAAAPVAIHRAPVAGMDFALGFAVTQAQLDDVSAQLVATDAPDPILWVAYSKGTSKTYRCEFNRDSGWHVLGAAGFEPVRQVALDADWSALRFRRVNRIATLTRRSTMALSPEGKRRAGG